MNLSPPGSQPSPSPTPSISTNTPPQRGGGYGNSKAGQELERRMMEMQIQDTLRLYNLTSEMCFNDCVNTFRTDFLTDTEELCTRRCVEKFLAFGARCQRVFAEQGILQTGEQ